MTSKYNKYKHYTTYYLTVYNTIHKSGINIARYITGMYVQVDINLILDRILKKVAQQKPKKIRVLSQKSQILP